MRGAVFGGLGHCSGLAIVLAWPLLWLGHCSGLAASAPHAAVIVSSSLTRAYPGEYHPAMKASSSTVRLEIVLVASILGCFLFHTLTSLGTTAPTFDEVAHFPAGYTHLTTGDPILNPEHPPLAKLLAALPVAPLLGDADTRIPQWRTMGEWDVGRALLFDSGIDPGTLINRARLPMIVLGLFLALVVYRWSRRLFGPVGGMVSLALTALSPIVLAHTRLITTDVPLAFLGTLAAFLAARLARSPSRRLAIAYGFAMGGALATKFSAIVFVPAIEIASLVALWIESNRGREARGAWHAGAAARRFVAHHGMAALAALVVVAFSYSWPPSLVAWIRGIATVGFNHTPGYPFYLLGRFSIRPFLLYFPIALLVKASGVFLLLMALLPLLLVSRRRRREAGMDRPSDSKGDLAFLILPGIVYLLFIMAKAPDIGIRYLIPCLPFAYVGLGAVGAWLGRHALGRVALVLLLGGQVLTAYASWPDPISYFNGLLGCSGPRAIRCLDDSNLDWGQDIGRVADALAALRSPDEQVVLLYFGTSIPTAWIHNWRAMKDDEIVGPAPQIYAVSLHALNRLNARLGRPNGMDWFQKFKPVAVVGNTYHIYDFREKLAWRGSPEPVAGDGK